MPSLEDVDVLLGWKNDERCFQNSRCGVLRLPDEAGYSSGTNGIPAISNSEGSNELRYDRSEPYRHIDKSLYERSCKLPCSCWKSAFPSNGLASRFQFLSSPIEVNCFRCVFENPMSLTINFCCPRCRCRSQGSFRRSNRQELNSWQGGRVGVIGASIGRPSSPRPEFGQLMGQARVNQVFR